MLDGLKRQVLALWKRLARIRATPHQVAAGFALGVFVSFLPIIPLRTVVALLLAWLLRQNIAAAFVGKSITLAYFPLVPLMWAAEYRLGTLINPVEKPVAIDRAHLGEVFHMGWDAFVATFIGGVMIGLPVALITYIVVWRLAQKWKLRRTQTASKPTG